MQKYLIIVGDNPEMAKKVTTAMREAGFTTNIPSDARLISVNTIRESQCDWAKCADDIYGFYGNKEVKLLWPEAVLNGKAFDLDGATNEREDKNHPPKGYRFVTKEDMKHPFPKDAGVMWWTSVSNKWIDSGNYPWWDSQNPHCIPVNYVFKAKTVKKMTVAEISEAMGVTVEIIEG